MALEKDGEKQQQLMSKKLGMRRGSTKGDRSDSFIVTPGYN